MKRVLEKMSYHCPNCGKVMKTNEGSSTMSYNLCKVGCAYCDEDYYYIVDENVLGALGKIEFIKDTKRIEELSGIDTSLYKEEMTLIYFEIGCYIELFSNRLSVPITNEVYEFETHELHKAISCLIENWVVYELM